MFRVLERFRFNTQWVDLIAALIKHNPISLLIDGTLTNFFTSGQGLKQGVPLSPTLFIIAKEVLCRGINCMLRNNKMQPTTFMNIGRESIKNLGNFLKEYEESLGQKINSKKSDFYISPKAPQYKIEMIELLTRWKKGEFPVQYLGGPIFHGGKSEAFWVFD